MHIRADCELAQLKGSQRECGPTQLVTAMCISPGNQKLEFSQSPCACWSEAL